MELKKSNTSRINVRRPRQYVDSFSVCPRASLKQSVQNLPASAHSELQTHCVTLINFSPSNRTIRDLDFVQKSKRLLNLDSIPATQAPREPAATVDTPSSTTQKPKNESSSLVNQIVENIQITARVKEIDTELKESVHENARAMAGFMLAKIGALFKGDLRSSFIMSMSVLLFIGGSIALVNAFSNNQAVITQVQALSTSSENQSGDTSNGFADLSEDPIPDSIIGAYTAGPDQPKFIKIPKLGHKQSRILKMGVDKDNSIQSPRSIWDAGWFEGSSKPSDVVGAPLIVGHVSGPNNGGIFYNLYRLIEGDEIQITTGDNQVHTYKVVAKEEVPVSNIRMNNYMVSKDINTPGLTLMTCAGEFNPITQQYENRLAIFALKTN